MWDWVQDLELESKFLELSTFEKTLLFFWALIPILSLEKTSYVYATLTTVLSPLSISINTLYKLLSALALLMLTTKRGLLKAAFAKPQCDFSILSKTRTLVVFLGLLGIFSLYLLCRHPEISQEMRKMAASAQVFDWLWKGWKEELTDRMIFYYIATLWFGRTGAFFSSMLFFSFAHTYNGPYMLNMIFAGGFYLFLMLWSGSLSLPFLVHILSNSAILILYKLSA